MRMNLKLFRIQKRLSQEEMAAKLGCKRATYACIENGKRSGRPEFWQSLQEAFGIPENKMFALMVNEHK